ncbi:MAG TPA: DUF1854 domain-containing protein [Methylibium sp.]|uniref:cyanophycin metabolism-associated DUF1854 family protein n=1 Tax=Methylibium sp. TaxID=2067992 RepID=UPI002DB78198|nr:DUF1854 domain-containing protein [Methylibium sp.]HEU4458077.1 DUF1854 domain-containing protein [Methylibium sp.]
MPLALRRDAHGRLMLTTADGREHAGVVPVRAFPLAAPGEGLSIVGPEGQELAWFDRHAELPEGAAALIAEELAQREFTPTIRQIRGVSTFSTPSTWDIATDRGDTTLVLKGEEDIRRLAGRALLIADAHGLRYRVEDVGALDKRSKRLLERFL